MGKRFMGVENDVIDDRIDVVSKGLLGLTVACARCHDHKFDPIPTKDYYSLHGIFSSSQEPAEEPIIAPVNKESADYKAYEAEIAKVDNEVENYRRTNAARLVSGMLDKAGEYLLAVQDSGRASDSSKRGDNFRLMARQRGLEAEVAFIWMDRVKSAAKTDAVLGPWLKFAELPADQFADRGPALAREIEAAGTFQPTLAAALAAKAPATLKDVAEVYTTVFGDLRKQLDLPTYTGLSRRRPEQQVPAHQGGGEARRADGIPAAERLRRGVVGHARPEAHVPRARRAVQQSRDRDPGQDGEHQFRPTPAPPCAPWPSWTRPIRKTRPSSSAASRPTAARSRRANSSPSFPTATTSRSRTAAAASSWPSASPAATIRSPPASSSIACGSGISARRSCAR
ncbi:MAG: DUF1549 domain-containing protein [Chthoniobacter sp.]